MDGNEGGDDDLQPHHWMKIDITDNPPQEAITQQQALNIANSELCENVYLPGFHDLDCIEYRLIQDNVRCITYWEIQDDVIEVWVEAITGNEYPEKIIHYFSDDPTYGPGSCVSCSLDDAINLIDDAINDDDAFPNHAEAGPIFGEYRELFTETGYAKETGTEIEYTYAIFNIEIDRYMEGILTEDRMIFHIHPETSKIVYWDDSWFMALPEDLEIVLSLQDAENYTLEQFPGIDIVGTSLKIIRPTYTFNTDYNWPVFGESQGTLCHIIDLEHPDYTLMVAIDAQNAEPTIIDGDYLYTGDLDAAMSEPI